MYEEHNKHQLSFRDRYVPSNNDYIMTHKGRSLIEKVVIYPPYSHPSICIIPELYRVDIQCTNGCIRSYGFRTAYIDSRLRVRVSGYNENFEEIKTWEIAPK